MLPSSDSRGLDLRGFYFFEATYEFTYVAAQCIERQLFCPVDDSYFGRLITTM